MDEPALLPDAVAAALAHGRTLLTGNQRAARTLRHHADLRNRALGLPHWQPPDLLAWDAWTAALWHRLLLDGHATRILLNRAQEHTLWRAIIAADREAHPETASLRSPDALAELAADAFARLAAHRGEPLLRDAGVSVDTRAFERWCLAFDKRCRAAGYLPPAQLETALTAAVNDGDVPLSAAGYVLLGFDRLTPAQAALRFAIRSAGIPLDELTLDAPAATGTLVAAEDDAEELHTAARWLRSHLEQHPNARLALIVPGLATHRPAIDRVLRQTLAPEREDLTALTGPQSPPPFEFSLGIPLAQTPLVAAALDLLHLAHQPLPLDRLSPLLLSPYFAGGTETSARAEFDASELRRLHTLRPELTLDALLRLVESARRAPRLPRLIATLKAMRRTVIAEALNLADEARPAADWADAIRALLHAAGWADGPDTSLEFQTRRKFDTLLDELATLDFEGQPLTFPDAFAALTRLARTTLFAPESRNAPVQVMGPLEAAGSTFDAVWFLRAGDLNWPTRPATSPLLPWHLQHDLRMPGADPADDAAHARRLTERLAQSTRLAVFSYAAATADGPQRPSATLAGLSLTPTTAAALLPAPLPRTPITLEVIDDSATLPPLPDRVIRGGATVLKLQAACGFRAFAEQRLWAAALRAVEPGMDARERGDIVHRALEFVWTELHDQATLKSLTADDRRATLTRAIDAALSKTKADSAWDDAYLAVQRERLLNLLDPWLLAEMDRAVPFTVSLQETELKDIAIGPLRLTLRVDRIDTTEFGDVILDYKTGPATPADWLTDRPDEPQLPLYAALAASDRLLAGVAFAQVRPGKDKGLHGYQTRDGILLKQARSTLPLEAQIDDWRRILTTLAEDFHAGDVRVRPKRYPTTCLYCAQRLLCRLDLSVLEDTSDEDAALEAPETPRG